MTRWLLLGPALLLTACAHVPVEVPFRAPPQSAAPIDWERVFANPVPLEVTPLYTGDVEVTRSMLLNLEHPALEDREDATLWVPVMAYLVRHPTHGALLLDSGMDSSFTASGNGNLGGLANLFDPFRQEPGRDTVSLLSALGVDRRDLRAILISHMHVDHTSGLPELPREAPVVVGPSGTDGYEPLWYAPWDHLAGRATVRTLDFTGLPDSGPGRAIDVLGDGSVFAIDAPGHVAGNLSFLLNGLGGPVLLTVDASHTREGFERGVEPGELVTDRAAAAATLARLRSFAEAHPALRVRFGHEPTDWDLTRGVQEPLFAR